MLGNVFVYLKNIENCCIREKNGMHSNVLRYSQIFSHTQSHSNKHKHTDRTECSVPISPSASMSEVEAVGGCDLSGLQQESSFWEYSFIAGDLDAYHQLGAEVLVMDRLLF